MTPGSKAVLILLVLIIQAFYWAPSAKPIDKVQEIRIAETAREMAASDNWIVPYYNGELRLQKPPLPYWLTAASYKIFGTVNEFSARFASATFAALTVFLLWWWINRALGLSSAVSTSIGFISSYIALRYFRSGEADAILLFFVTAACIIVYDLLFMKATLKRVLLLHLCMGLGFLAKGPAAIAIPLVTLLWFALKNRQFDVLKKCLHPAGLLILLVTGFGWYGLIFYTMPEQANLFVSGQIDSTFITGNHPNPFYWYIPHLFEFFAPWSVFIIPAAIWLYKTPSHPPAVNYAAAWFIATFIMLSLNVNKQVQYGLLLAPPLMILLGHYLASAAAGYARINKIILISLITVTALALVVIFFKWEGIQDFPAGKMLLLLTGCLLPFAVAKLLRYNEPTRYRELLLAGIMVSGWIYGQFHLYHAPGGKGDLKQFALAAKDYSPLFIYTEADPRLSFYIERVIPVMKDEQDMLPILDKFDTLYLITEGERFNPAGKIFITKIIGNEKFSLWKLTQKNLSEN
ncbi:MAG: glycosyltransferase family 39 protein [Gammaproteobacteria bacterium]